MAILNDKAGAVASAFSNSHAKFAAFGASSPFIDMLLKLLPVLLQFISGCGLAAKDGAEIAARPGILGKWYKRRLATQIRKNADVDDEMVEPLVNALIEVGKTTTADEEAAILAS